MSLTLYFHPLASYCHKVLVGLYELDIPFTRHVVDLGDPAQRAALAALWPVAKFPVLRDEARDVTVAESSIVLEYVDGGRGWLLPADADAARECRTRDRFFDLYVHDPMQRIVADRLRPEAGRDAYGVAEAKAQLERAYAIADTWMQKGPWAIGEAFTMADCAAAPALFYANEVLPFGDRHPHLAAYFARLGERPSFARVLREAEPYLHMFPR